MKRAHRKAHLIMWLVLTPAIAAVLVLALTQRPEAPINNALPDVLIEAAP